MLWVIVFGALTTQCWESSPGGLLIVHALAYGALTVVAPEVRAARPSSGRHALAFGVGVMVHFAIASTSTLLAPRTTIRVWPPVALGLAASPVAATFASCALLLTLGIRPVAFLLDL